MKKYVYIVTALLFITTLQSYGQDKLRMDINYNVSAPLGDFKSNFISNTSGRGVTGGINYTINPQFSVGVSTGFQNYYQKYDRQVYKTTDNQTISAVMSNSLEVIPFLLKGTYYPVKGNSVVKPYISVAGGVNMINYTQYLGEFGGSETSVPLAAQAGAGIEIPFGKANNQTAFKIGATYNYSAYNKNDLSNLNSVGANAGVVFKLK